VATCFFQKSFPNYLPDGVTQKKLADGTTIFFIRNTRGLVSLAQFTADDFTIHEPLTLPTEWITPEPQLIPKALLRRLTGGK